MLEGALTATGTLDPCTPFGRVLGSATPFRLGLIGAWAGLSKLRAVVRDRAIVGTEASAPNVAELLAAVPQLTPRGHKLAQLGGRVDGKLLSTAVFQSTLTSTVEAEVRDYPPARAALSTMVPAEQLVLSARVLD